MFHPLIVCHGRRSLPFPPPPCFWVCILHLPSLACFHVSFTLHPSVSDGHFMCRCYALEVKGQASQVIFSDQQPNQIKTMSGSNDQSKIKIKNSKKPKQ